ncbi:response regulator transcription factor [Ferrimonas lipolytica]|uniref:Response regulator transcription factor n=1 Tax=Ferrimonas lipolytica TaxID=2724191 RepID=A0A6H1U9W6_9GAMM|nr:response regulator transcription factor [Ferrimonas lipolytica]QIZ75618.1 response regulator transcription factor [Ferrimonas lipolytica]
MLNLLVVEDDLDLAASLIDYLELEEMQCDHAANGLAALELINSNNYDVIVLDLNLPKLDGLQVCQQMRAAGNDSPVLMLTARDSLDDKVNGFQSGTDDYLVKPFAMEELVVRVLALSKRRSGQTTKLIIADLQMDLSLKQVHRGQRALKLTPTGYKLLQALMRVAPEPLSREALMKAVWGDDQPDSNSLKVHLHKLRKQVDLEGELLLTIPNVGFALRQEVTDAP